MNLRYKPGLRAIKTSIAVFLCLLISVIFKRSDILLASIASIICLQPTDTQTYQEGLNRTIGTLLGGGIGYLILLCTQSLNFSKYINIILAPIAILLIIYICNVINRSDSIVIGCIVVLSVLMWTYQTISDPFMYVVDRVIDTSIGIFVAIFINKFLFIKHNKKHNNK